MSFIKQNAVKLINEYLELVVIYSHIPDCDLNDSLNNITLEIVEDSFNDGFITISYEELLNNLIDHYEGYNNLQEELLDFAEYYYFEPSIQNLELILTEEYINDIVNEIKDKIVDIDLIEDEKDKYIYLLCKMLDNENSLVDTRYKDELERIEDTLEEKRIVKGE